MSKSVRCFCCVMFGPGQVVNTISCCIENMEQQLSPLLIGPMPLAADGHMVRTWSDALHGLIVCVFGCLSSLQPIGPFNHQSDNKHQSGPFQSTCILINAYSIVYRVYSSYMYTYCICIL